jgi:hypothetical protein
MSSRTHLHSHSFSDSGNNATASIAVPTPPTPRQDGGGPNKRDKVVILIDHVLVLILSCLTAAPCAAASVSIAPGIALSQDPSTVRSCSRFLPDSSTTAKNANVTSPALMVNTPPCPSYPSGCRNLRLLLGTHPLLVLWVLLCCL